MMFFEIQKINQITINNILSNDNFVLRIYNFAVADFSLRIFTQPKGCDYQIINLQSIGSRGLQPV